MVSGVSVFGCRPGSWLLSFGSAGLMARLVPSRLRWFWKEAVQMSDIRLRARQTMEPEPHPLVSLLAACFWVIRMNTDCAIRAIAN